jgi:hypothetical protein
MCPYFGKNTLDVVSELPMPTEPTVSMAGSMEKIEIMRQRLANGKHLHHPCDELRFETPEEGKQIDSELQDEQSSF